MPVDQSAQRARTLAFNDKTVADFKNWLDFLEHMDHDAYVTLMRYMVGTGVIEHHDWVGDIRHWLSPTHFWKHKLRHECWHRDINIYGLLYTTTTHMTSTGNAYIDIGRKQKEMFEKKNLLAAAEANGIKVYKSWSKPRIWKALLSA